MTFAAIYPRLKRLIISNLIKEGLYKTKEFLLQSLFSKDTKKEVLEIKQKALLDTLSF